MVKKGQAALLMIALAIIVLACVVGLFYFVDLQLEKTNVECESGDDCVPSSCCHSDSCVPKSKVPNCDEIFCTAVCEPGTLDCGQGSCRCINKKCEAVFNE